VARVIGPVEEFLGPAILAFLEPTAVDLGDDPRVTWVPAGHESMQHLAATCDPQDAQESGILAVESSLAVWLVAGRIVAASGYQVWHGHLGHLSVLVDPTFRGRGLGKAVAAGRSARWSTPAWCHSGGPAARSWRRARSPAPSALSNWAIRPPTSLPGHGEASWPGLRDRRGPRATTATLAP
jgi:GNAT superfamily N-acetyltransferase